MYIKYIFILPLLLLASNQEFEYIGVDVNVTLPNKAVKTLTVKRDIPDVCKKVLITNKNLWTGDFAHASVPKVCKSTFVHTKGKLLAMTLDDDIETYGELEVLVFIKEMQKDSNLLLIDGRTEPWYEYFTIPGAINIPFVHIKRSKEYEFEFEDALKKFGVKILKENEYDFSKSKTLLIFCNGPWCSQSPDMIFALLELGYPAENLKWYRGGIQDWLSAGMTTTLDVK
ncbi:MAG: rhodanese-like domain-containing protein [Sulfurovum sp.]|nr:rhodanese-like domain-containing protein [Sulfurovum sp.]